MRASPSRLALLCLALIACWPLGAPAQAGAGEPARCAIEVGAADAAGARRARTRPPRAAVLSDRAAAARVRCRPLELRPQNEENRYVPSRAELAAFRRAQVELATYEDHVTGRFVGTTDEIIQWAAWKWGIDEDLVRAIAVRESGWDMDMVGDAGESFGIMQIKPRFHLGTDPLARRSTAFNLDYFGAHIRYYYDGRATWLRRWSPRRRPYRAGSIWGSAGAWYAGRWYSAGARRYIASVRAELAARAWTRPAF